MLHGERADSSHTHTCGFLLTAVVVVAPWQKLKAQRERCEPLDLFREAHWPKGSVLGVALPPLDGPSGLNAALESSFSYKVKGHRLWRSWAQGALAGVVWTVNVQVVI